MNEKIPPFGPRLPNPPIFNVDDQEFKTFFLEKSFFFVLFGEFFSFSQFFSFFFL